MAQDIDKIKEEHRKEFISVYKETLKEQGWLDLDNKIFSNNNSFAYYKRILSIKRYSSICDYYNMTNLFGLTLPDREKLTSKDKDGAYIYSGYRIQVIKYNLLLDDGAWEIFEEAFDNMEECNAKYKACISQMISTK